MLEGACTQDNTKTSLYVTYAFSGDSMAIQCAWDVAVALRRNDTPVQLPVVLWSTS